MQGPFSRRISQICDADATGQTPIDCGLHQVRCQERERYRHIDLTNSAVFSGSDLLNIRDRSRDQPATTIGMGALIAIGVLLMILIGHSDETGLTAITIAIIMIIAASNPQDAWLQPLLRLADTLVGIAVGVACKWVASFVFYRIFGEDYRGVGM